MLATTGIHFAAALAREGVQPLALLPFGSRQQLPLYMNMIGSRDTQTKAAPGGDRLAFAAATR